MSYDHRLLCERISLCLHRNPKSSLRSLSRELHVSPRTIQNAVIKVTGKKFRKVRDEFLLEGIRDPLVSTPTQRSESYLWKLATGPRARLRAPSAALAA